MVNRSDRSSQIREPYPNAGRFSLGTSGRTKEVFSTAQPLGWPRVELILTLTLSQSSFD
jgi:hypothetical protein